MTLTHFVFLLAAGIIAGLLSTIAGLASLASYPALLMIGIPPVIANVTNTAALVFTGIGATFLIPAGIEGPLGRTQPHPDSGDHWRGHRECCPAAGPGFQF